jgi:hypothetical protein
MKIREIDPQEDDIFNVLDWMGVTEDDVEISDVETYPISTFIKQIKEEEADPGYNTEKDRAQIDFIKSLLQAGKRQYPVVAISGYEGDELIVREGHHRLRATYELGIKTIPVIVITERPDVDYD